MAENLGGIDGALAIGVQPIEGQEAKHMPQLVKQSRKLGLERIAKVGPHPQRPGAVVLGRAAFFGQAYYVRDALKERASGVQGDGLRLAAVLRYLGHIGTGADFQFAGVCALNHVLLRLLVQREGERSEGVERVRS